MSKKKAILVTGASTGIGLACVQDLLKNGCRVFAAVRKPADAERLKALGAEPVMMDVTDAAAIAQVAQQLSQELGESGLHGLVNNAGVAVAAPMEYVPIEDLRWQFEVNVFGQVAVTQAFLPLIRKAKGRVVFVSSISGKLSAPMMGPYSGSKFAIEAIADSLRMELRQWGIEISVIEPGMIATPIWDTSLSAADDRELRMGPDALARYGDFAKAAKLSAYQGAKHGSPPSLVSRDVVHALLSDSPKTRYVMGKDAKAQAVVRMLPDRWRDSLILKVMADKAKKYREPKG